MEAEDPKSEATAAREDTDSAPAGSAGEPESSPAAARPSIHERRFAQVSRRELLKLTPILALGAFAIPGVQQSLLEKGLGFSDWASARLFRSGHLATTFADSQLTAFEKFPINDYDVDD